LVTSAEHERFLTLYDRLVTHTSAWLSATPDDRVDWEPIQSDTMRFGDRVSRITIKGVIAHTVASEAHWARLLNEIDDGDRMPVPGASELVRQLEGADFDSVAKTAEAQTLVLLRSLSESQLRKTVIWQDRTWTVMGFLWGIYAHRAFHVGNIDILLRQAGVLAPDFFRFQPLQMA
jgi:uncharacterized damage-inducible protein DinB